MDWLTDAFRFKGYLMRDGRVTSLSMKAIGEGQGAFGDLVLVTVTFEGGRLNAPSTFVAKFAPACTGTVKRLETRVIFLNEAHFYNDFTIQDGACARPECYLVACEPRSSEPSFCFLLENMLPATTWTRTEGCSSLPHLQMVMRMLARFHARWWGHSKAPPLDWAMHPSDYAGIFRHVFISMHKKGLPALARCFGIWYAPILEWLPQLQGRYGVLYELVVSAHTLTLVHGDCHLDNIFFSERYPNGCALIDFALVAFGPAVRDVCFFLGTNIEPAVRRAHEGVLLRTYHAELLAAGVPSSYTWEQCWRDYRIQLWWPLVQLLTLTPTWAKERKARTGMWAERPTAADAKLKDMYDKYHPRLVAALTDHAWDQLLSESDTRCGACPCFSFCA